jgi:hypothetical protein
MIHFLVLVFPFFAYAYKAQNPEFVRVLDGQVVKCRERHEVGKLTYTPKASEVSVQGDSLQLALDLDFFSCVFVGEKCSLAPKLPLEPWEYKNAKGDSVRFAYRSGDLVLGDSDFNPLVSLSLENKSSQRVSARLALDKVLSQGQLRRLRSGKPVRARLTLVARRMGSMVSRGVASSLGRKSLGAYTFFVRISP